MNIKRISVIEKIKKEFKDEYHVSVKSYGDRISDLVTISKYNGSSNVVLEVKVTSISMGATVLFIKNPTENLYEEVNDKTYLEIIKIRLEIIDKNINMYYDFMKEFTDSLELSEIENINMDYSINFVSNNAFIINRDNGRILKFSPIFEYDNDNVKVSITTIDGVGLMDIILPAANYSDAFDSIKTLIQ